MAKQETSTDVELKAIELLKKELNVSQSIYEAVKTANGWRNGKEVTKSQYKKAVDDFLKSPMKGAK